MNKKKKYIVIGSIALLILITSFLSFNFDNKNELSVTTPSLTDTKSIKVSLVVLDKKYEINVKDKASVFDAMEKIQKESTIDNIFNFKYISNTSLGNFITEINGQYGTPGKYWIYYVNNKKASIGVSNYFLEDGDIISWSQEGV